MDYLREGINLRAMGQRDPLTEWQREGFEMFGQMMHGVSQDFIRYVMHVQVQVNQPAPVDPEVQSRVTNFQYSAPEDPSSSGGAASMAAAVRSGDGGGNGAAEAPVPQREPQNVPVVKSDWDKTPRNAPCPCGSGKKYKQCHGA